MRINRIVRKKRIRYDLPGFAHALTFSCYHSRDYLKDPVCCRILLEELDDARTDLEYRLWAYVFMPNHIHILLFPTRHCYHISDFLQVVKGKSSKRYRHHLLANNFELYERRCVESRGRSIFRLWQVGGGYDRNLWSSTAIQNTIRYIENNPVKANLIDRPENWVWSSAWARYTGKGVKPDDLIFSYLM